MASFQKRHYQAIAAIVAAEMPGHPSDMVTRLEVVETLTAKLADYFASDNPLFNRDTFAKACHGEDYRGKRRVA